MLALLLASLLAAATPQDEDGPPELPPLSEAQSAALAAIADSGGRAVALAQNDPRLDVAFHLAGGEVTAEQLDAVVALRDRVVGLNLRGTDVTDEAVREKVSKLTELRTLHLEKTGVTDAALPALAKLGDLESLNLYGTKVTDAGIQNLAGMKGLRRLYIWQTGVTTAGAVALLEQRPDLEIVGVDLPKPPRKPLVAPRPDAGDAE